MHRSRGHFRTAVLASFVSFVVAGCNPSQRGVAYDGASGVVARRSELAEISREKDPRAWALAQAEVGNALYRQARGNYEASGMQLTREAVEAYESALEAFDPDTQAPLLAMVEDNLGTALGKLADGAAGVEEKAALRAEAAAVYRRAIAGYARLGQEQDRARAESRLGWQLYLQSFAAATEDGARQLDEAAAALRGALATLSMEDPETRDLWAESQVNLGTVLEMQATRGHGPESDRLLDEASAAYAAASRIHSRDRKPEAWARLEISRAIVLHRQAARSGGDRAERLFGEAKSALRGAAEIFPATGWNGALVRNNLAHTLTTEAEQLGGAGAARQLEEAVAASRESLTVWTREKYPQDWAYGQVTLGNALLAQGQAQEGGERKRLLGEAEAAVRGALEVYTRESSPQDWAMACNDLGEILLARGAQEGDEKLFEEALAAFRDALAVRTREALPGRYAETRSNEAKALAALGLKKEAAAIEGEVGVFAPEAAGS